MNSEKAVKEFFSGISEQKHMYFVGTTIKNSIMYMPNEEIVFKIRPKSEDEYIKVPYIFYTIEGDDGQKSEGFCIAENDGWFYIKTTLKCKGFVHLFAYACDENKNRIDEIEPFEGGAGAEVEDLHTGTETPDDYFEFWNRLKKEVEQTEPVLLYKQELDTNYKEINVSDGNDKYAFYDMRIKVTEDMYASCLVSYPKDAKPESLKLVMQYMGYGIGSATIKGIDDSMLVVVNAHSIPNLKEQDYYDNLRDTTLFRYGLHDEKNENPDTTYWKQMFMRNLQVLRYFKDSELLNKKDYIFYGGSQGAMQACNMAVHSEIATECILVFPWMADLGGGKKFNRMVAPWRANYKKGLCYFDTAVAAQFLKCPATIVAGLGDYICPPSGIMTIYNSVDMPKKLIFIQNATHPYRPVERIAYKLGDYEKADSYKKIVWEKDQLEDVVWNNDEN